MIQICLTNKEYLVNSFKKESYALIDIFWKVTRLSVIDESIGKCF